MTKIEVVNIYPPNTIDVVIQSSTLASSEWYKDILFYVTSSQFPLGMCSKEKIYSR